MFERRTLLSLKQKDVFCCISTIQLLILASLFVAIFHFADFVLAEVVIICFFSVILSELKFFSVHVEAPVVEILKIGFSGPGLYHYCQWSYCGVVLCFPEGIWGKIIGIGIFGIYSSCFSLLFSVLFSNDLGYFCKRYYLQINYSSRACLKTFVSVRISGNGGVFGIFSYFMPLFRFLVRWSLVSFFSKFPYYISL